MSNTAATRAIIIEREFPHDPEKVWRALTESALIEEWLMKNDFKAVVGRKFNFRAEPMPHWNGVTDCECWKSNPTNGSLIRGTLLTGRQQMD
jgi:uncharacterized protein YndB with AHSA1/START domain